jgi:replicative DNA helicase
MNPLDQTIPHSVESEQCVIGAILIDHKAIDKISSLKADHFYVAAHREIFSAMITMASKGERIDVITLAESLFDLGKEHSSGGLPYLGQMAANTPGARNIKRYAEIVVEKAIERQLLAACEDIRASVLGRGAIKDKINTAQMAVMAISETRQQKQPRVIGDALNDYVATLERRMSGENRGLSTGLGSLDEKLSGGLQDGNLIIIAGRPAMGKSAFSNTIAINIAKHGDTAAIMSMEMTEFEQIDRVVATLGHVDLQDVLDAKLDGDSGDKIMVAISKMRELPLVIDEEAGLSVHEVMSKARQIKRTRGLKLLVVDALGLMDYDANKAVSELGVITKTLKGFAKEMNIPVVLLCQLSRKCEERTDKRPVLSDLRDSGNIEQDADVVMMLYRDVYYNPGTPDENIAEILIRKNRQGKTGCVPLVFIGNQSRFEVLDRHDWTPASAASSPSKSHKSRMGND